MLKPGQSVKISTKKLNLFYGDFHALKDIDIDIPEFAITAIIGPSGCGKSSLLRVFNRMNDLIPIAKTTGEAFMGDLSIYDKATDVPTLRKKIGMVFQKPNVFPTSIYDNLVIAPLRQGAKRKDLPDLAERCLTQVNLWNDLKDVLKKNALSLTPEQQQRLCIARALAVKPEVILMDESCSALDPESTMRIEALMTELSQNYTIIIVTHNMEQAMRVSDMSAFMMIDEKRAGNLVEYEPTTQMFSKPKDKRTEDYITGRFG
ncbi:MAG: phosphate ABC transporter ATP-binding protein [Firmicutes bacterium]|nr:phosphate ABC transporter ATP-binding protein [Bacillota bacterium]